MEDVRNTFTRELDTFRKEQSDLKFFSTYLMNPDNPIEKDGVIWIPIREIGRTLGAVVVDNNRIVKEVKINKLDSPFKPEIYEHIKEYVGYVVEAVEVV